jgi:hypothetical protein
LSLSGLFILFALLLFHRSTPYNVSEEIITGDESVRNEKVEAEDANTHNSRMRIP